MKAPDKIYVREYQDGDYSTWYSTWWDEEPHEAESIGMKAVCYISKDALMDWLNNVLDDEIFISKEDAMKYVEHF